MASLQHDAPTTPLRQRMQEHMLMPGLGSHTRQDYIRQVRRYATFLGRAPRHRDGRGHTTFPVASA